MSPAPRSQPPPEGGGREQRGEEEQGRQRKCQRDFAARNGAIKRVRPFEPRVAGEVVRLSPIGGTRHAKSSRDVAFVGIEPFVGQIVAEDQPPAVGFAADVPLSAMPCRVAVRIDLSLGPGVGEG